MTKTTFEKNKKNIAVNTRFLIHNNLEGIGNFTYESLKRIVHSHPDIDFYFLFDRKYSDEFIFSENVKPVILFPSARHPLLWFWWFELSVARWLRKNKPDLFLSLDGFGCLRTRVPEVIVLHDLAFEHFNEHIPSIARAYYRRFTPLYARKAKKIATVSEFSKNDIINYYHIPPEKIDVVYNGVSEEFYPINDETKIITRNKYSDGKKYFLYVGSIHPRKNVPRLLQAFDLFKSNTQSEHKLLIVGREAWDYKEVHSALSDMTYSDSVSFLGYVPKLELPNITASADAMFLISLFEGFGVPIIEAMKCDVPVITSNVTSMPEIAGDAAILVNPTSIDDIVSAMKIISRDPQLRMLLIEKGRIQAKKFSWELSGLKLWECCKQFVA